MNDEALKPKTILLTSMQAEEVSFCLDGLAEVLVNAVIAACQADPQILEALQIVTKYGESQT